MRHTFLTKEQELDIQEVLKEVLEDNGCNLKEALKALSRGVSVQFKTPVISSFQECSIGPDRIYIHCLTSKRQVSGEILHYYPTRQTVHLTFGLDMIDQHRFAITEADGEVIGISFCTPPNIYAYFDVNLQQDLKRAI
jgi:hypothetical protein